MIDESLWFEWQLKDALYLQFWANHQPNANITYAYDGMITMAMNSWKQSMYAKMPSQRNHGHGHGHGHGHNHGTTWKNEPVKEIHQWLVNVKSYKLRPTSIISIWRNSAFLYRALGKYDDNGNAAKTSKYGYKYGNYQQKQQEPSAYAEPTYNRKYTVHKAPSIFILAKIKRLSDLWRTLWKHMALWIFRWATWKAFLSSKLWQPQHTTSNYISDQPKRWRFEQQRECDKLSCQIHE